MQWHRLLLIVMLFVPAPAGANEPREPMANALPTALVGRLTNGVSYYIEPDHTPGKRIQIELHVRAGSLDSEAAETDVAHVVEHIVFSQGSGRGAADLAERLRAMGDSNASAGIVSTIYFLKAPSNDISGLNGGLAILANWIRATMGDADIDRERNVVIEENRRNNRFAIRRNNLNWAIWFGRDSRFGNPQSPVGTIAASPAAIRAFHAAYYRPSNMAVLVSGPIDPVVVRTALQSNLAFAAEQPMAGPSRPIRPPEVKGGHVVPMIDPDAAETVVQLSFKYRSAESAAAEHKAIQLVANRLLERASQMLLDRDGAPIISASIRTDYPNNFAKIAGVEIVLGHFVLRSPRLSDGLRELLTFASGVRRRGFSRADFDRMRAEVLEALIPNNAGGDRWMRAFASGRAEPQIDDVRRAVETLTSDTLNRTLLEWLDPANRDIVIVARPELRVPDDRTISTFIAEAERRPPIRFIASSFRAPRLSALPRPAVVPRLAQHQAFWIGSLAKSGAAIIYRKIDGDQVNIVISRRGGLVRFPFPAPVSAAFDIVTPGETKKLALNRYLARRGVNVRPFLAANREGFSANGPASELGLILALIRSYFVEPRCTEAALQAWRSDRAEILPQGDDGLEARAALGRLIDDVLGTGREAGDQHVTGRAAELCGLYKQTLGNMRGMVVVAEGPEDVGTAAAMIASALDLNGTPPAGLLHYPPVRSTTGERHVTLYGRAEKANVALVLQRGGSGSAIDGEIAELAKFIIEPRLFRRLREQEQGVYSVDASFSTWSDPDAAALNISFECRTDAVDRLVAAAKEVLVQLRDFGPTTVEIADARTARTRVHDSVHTLAERWIAHGTVERPPFNDAQIRTWFGQNLRIELLDTFIRLPGPTEAPKTDAAGLPD